MGGHAAKIVGIKKHVVWKNSLTVAPTPACCLNVLWLLLFVGFFHDVYVCAGYKQCVCYTSNPEYSLELHTLRRFAWGHTQQLQGLRSEL
jgi:hypothetical protein